MAEDNTQPQIPQPDPALKRKDRFTGKFSEDGNSFKGGWRPNPGADETVNVPYDIGGGRQK